VKGKLGSSEDEIPDKKEKVFKRRMPRLRGLGI